MSFSNSWRTVKSSWNVLKQDKELLLFPVISGLASAIILGSFLFGTIYTGLFERAVDQEDPNAQNAVTLIYFAMYLILSFVTIYFNAALIHAANERLAGGDPNVMSGLRGANQRLGKIFLWSLFAGTVSLLIHLLEQAMRGRNNFVGQIVTAIVGTAWTLATYFAIPVVLFEDRGVFSSLKRSGQLFRQRWGASLVGQYGIAFVFNLLGIAVIFATFMLVNAAGGVTPVGIALLVLGVFAFLFVTVFGLALGGVYRAALYRYATTAQVPAGFQPELVQNAYVSRA